MCLWFSLQVLSEIFFYSKKNWTSCDKKMFIGLHVKYRLLLSEFNESWIFSTDIRKILRRQILMKIRPFGAELFHADGQTEMAKLI